MKFYQAEVGPYPIYYEGGNTNYSMRRLRVWKNRIDLFDDWVAHQKTYYYARNEEKNWVYSGYINEFVDGINIEDYLPLK